MPVTPDEDIVRAICSEKMHLELRQIDKAFFGVRVLKQVDLVVPPGKTVGLVGENGAGKSTLMNILGGNLQPDGGEMILGERRYSPRSPQDASRAGIAFIHQELNLFANLSIAENIWIANFPRVRIPGLGRVSLPLIYWPKARRRTSELLAEVGLSVSPDAPVGELSAGERQLVEVAKALSADARILILDEPTTSLTSRECDHLFQIMEKLRSRGLSMIYISHALEDVLRWCDEVTVLRDGEVVGQGSRSNFDMDRLIALMVGRSISQVFPPRQTRASSEVLLEARGLSHPGIVENISFQLHRGEVLGISGLMGSGRSELARILFGLDRCQHGEVRIRQEAMAGRSARRSIGRRVAFLTENRRQEGLCLEASIGENMSLVSLRSFSRAPVGWIDGRRLSNALHRMRQAVRLTPTARLDQPVKTLSGGNQQKVVLAKWLLAEPDILILDEPTRGIDVGAKFEVYQLINQMAEKGAGILMISSELEELIGLCDRILVMANGEIRETLAVEAFDRQRILRAAFGGGEELGTASV